MAHTCPDCGKQCTCCGENDIDWTDSEDCIHCHPYAWQDDGEEYDEEED